MGDLSLGGGRPTQKENMHPEFSKQGADPVTLTICANEPGSAKDVLTGTA